MALFSWTSSPRQAISRPASNGSRRTRMDTESLPHNNHSAHSSRREMVLDHMFMGELLRYLWRTRECNIEVLRSQSTTPAMTSCSTATELSGTFSSSPVTGNPRPERSASISRWRRSPVVVSSGSCSTGLRWNWVPISGSAVSLASHCRPWETALASTRRATAMDIWI